MAENKNKKSTLRPDQKLAQRSRTARNKARRIARGRNADPKQPDFVTADGVRHKAPKWARYQRRHPRT